MRGTVLSACDMARRGAWGAAMLVIMLAAMITDFIKELVELLHRVISTHELADPLTKLGTVDLA